jgi:hypothetical protein
LVSLYICDLRKTLVALTGRENRRGVPHVRAARQAVRDARDRFEAGHDGLWQPSHEPRISGE